MVIQRIQTVFLLLAVIFTAIFCFTPCAVDLSAESATDIYVWSNVVLLIAYITASVLLLADIFMFKNLKKQIYVATSCGTLLIAMTVCTVCYIFSAFDNAELVWTGGIILPVAAAICAFVARHFMLKDKKLLQSYDRLR